MKNLMIIFEHHTVIGCYHNGIYMKPVLSIKFFSNRDILLIKQD